MERICAKSVNRLVLLYERVTVLKFAYFTFRVMVLAINSWFSRLLNTICARVLRCSNSKLVLVISCLKVVSLPSDLRVLLLLTGRRSMPCAILKK